MAAHYNTAVHLQEHGDQNEGVNAEHQDTHGRVFAVQQIFVPASIQEMVNEKEHEHARAHPFMRRLPPELITHQKEQRQGHEDIEDDFIE